jgi:hypothetical protein
MEPSCSGAQAKEIEIKINKMNSDLMDFIFVVYVNLKDRLLVDLKSFQAPFCYKTILILYILYNIV